MVGSPFAFPVQVVADPEVVSGIYFYGDSTDKDGWEIQGYEMDPWAGYAVHSGSEGATLELLPYTDAGSDGSVSRSTVSSCLLYTTDAADDTPRVALGGRRIIKKK